MGVAVLGALIAVVVVVVVEVVAVVFSFCCSKRFCKDFVYTFLTRVNYFSVFWFKSAALTGLCFHLLGSKPGLLQLVLQVGLYFLCRLQSPAAFGRV